MVSIDFHRKAIEQMYIGSCTITEKVKSRNESGIVSFSEIIVLENEPCYLIFTINNTTNLDINVASTTQGVKLFLAPEIDIKEGSKIVVLQNNRTFEYTRSGTPAVYSSHQEIELELFKKYA